MPVALATAAQLGQQLFVVLHSIDGDRVESGTLEVDQGAAGRIGVEHPARGRGRALGPHPHGDRGQHRRQVGAEAGVGGG
jgi:hypothetical protein